MMWHRDVLIEVHSERQEIPASVVGTVEGLVVRGLARLEGNECVVSNGADLMGLAVFVP